MRQELEALVDWLDAFFEGDRDPINDDIKALVVKARAALGTKVYEDKDDPCAYGGKHVDEWECDAETVRCKRCGMAFGSAAFWREKRQDAPGVEPVPAPSSRPTVKVRIPIRVRADGSWTACSFHSSDLQEGRAGDYFADTSIPHEDRWVVAEVGVPEAPPEVNGEATP